MDKNISRIIAEVGGVAKARSATTPAPPAASPPKPVGGEIIKVDYATIMSQDGGPPLTRDRDITTFSEAAASAVSAIRPALNRLSMQASDGSNGHTISRRTMDDYRDRAVSLFERFSTETGLPLTDSHMYVGEFAEWFLRLKFKVSPSTWRSYRAAVLFFIGRMPGDEPIIAATMISSAYQDDNQQEPGKTIKHIPTADFDKILWACHQVSSVSSTELSNFMRASIRCGLRPIEWAFSELRSFRDDQAPFGRHVWLFVCNAKASNGRANGPVRAIDLSDLDNKFIDPIIATSKSARFYFELDGNIDSWLGKIRKNMQHYCKKANTLVVYSPYVLRHQAIANWKSVYSAIQVAALAGHAVPETAATHYGRMRDAWSAGRLKNMLVLPSVADVNRIETRIMKPLNRSDGLNSEMEISDRFVDTL